MKNILILNLGTTNDLLSSAHLIGAIKTSDSNTNIEIVTAKENQDIANIINNVSKVHFLDTQLIKNVLENKLYSDAFAINEFMSVINPLTEGNWDKVINYSNDNVSSYLISALNAENKVGTYINDIGAPRHTGQWSIYQNFVASNLMRQSIDKITIRNHMVGLPVYSDIEKIKNSADYSMVAGQNFSRIRKMNGSPATFVIGINLESGYDDYSMELDTLTDLIEAMEESTDYKPVLLLNGKNYQRQLANDLNKQFNNNLISINIETIALPSVMANLDALISTSSDQLTIADTMDVKSIELRDFSGKTYTPTVFNSGNYTIYAKEERTLSSDILLALNEEFGTELPINYMSSENPVYKSVQDDYGSFFTQIRGNINIQKELRYHIERSFFFQAMGYAKNEELFSHIRENTEGEHLTKFITTLKSELTSTVKILLATLRSLKSVRNSQSNLDSFVSYLDTLITIGKEDSIVSSIIRNFEGRIENIEADNIDTNIKSIETNLFQLKSELQALTNIMADLFEVDSSRSIVKENINTEA